MYSGDLRLVQLAYIFKGPSATNVEELCRKILRRYAQLLAQRFIELTNQGLSLLFFMLSMLGNLTYGASVCGNIVGYVSIANSVDFASFYRTSILPQEPTMADRLFG